MIKELSRAILTTLALSALVIGCGVDSDLTPAPAGDVELSALQHGDAIPGQYIVVFHDDAVNVPRGLRDFSDTSAWVRADAEALLLDVGASPEAIGRVYGTALEGFVARLDHTGAEALAGDWRVAYIEPDRVISLDLPRTNAPPPGKGPGGGDGGGGQVTPYGITRVGGPGSGAGKVAWVIDTGIDLDHPDLNVDSTRGFSAFTTGKDASFDDGNGHGTHVAGTIAAVDNTTGVVGVAAGATVVPVKVLSSNGSGSTSGVIAGVDHVAANAGSGDVANMSLGGGISTALDDAVVSASSAARFSLAAGNSGDDANNHSPARANGSRIYTISAIDSNDNMPSWSNWGNPPVDYAAPGVSVTSTWKGGGYNTISGTSMAAPHAAGVLLLGSPRSDGTANNDPDGNPDPIIHR